MTNCENSNVSLASVFGERIAWELPVQYGASDCVKSNDVILDIGGHIGGVAVAFSRMVPDGHVYTFEPNKETWPHLVENIRINQAGNITHVPMACFKETGKILEFFSEDSFYKAGSGLLNPLTNANKFNVVSVSVDDFCKVNELSPAFMKIDVEGAELFVLQSARQTLETVKPSLIIEYLCQEHPEVENDPLVFLETYGYRFFDVNTYQSVDAKYYSQFSHQNGYLVNVLCVHKSSPVCRHYDLLQISLAYEVKELSPNKFESEEFYLTPGRYIVEIDFEAPDDMLASLGVSDQHGYIAYYEANCAHLKQHSCSSMVVDLKEGTDLKVSFERKEDFDVTRLSAKIRRLDFPPVSV